MMNKHKQYVEKAKKEFQTIDHLIYMTYPLVKDKKLLIAITMGLFEVVKSCMGALLEKERLERNIMTLPINFNSRFFLFREKCAEKYGIKDDMLKLISELNKVVEEQNENSNGFMGEEELVICNEGYTNLKTLDINLLKDYATKIRKFLEVVKQID